MSNSFLFEQTQVLAEPELLKQLQLVDNRLELVEKFYPSLFCLAGKTVYIQFAINIVLIATANYVLNMSKTELNNTNLYPVAYLRVVLCNSRHATDACIELYSILSGKKNSLN